MIKFKFNGEETAVEFVRIVRAIAHCFTKVTLVDLNELTLCPRGDDIYNGVYWGSKTIRYEVCPEYIDGKWSVIFPEPQYLDCSLSLKGRDTVRHVDTLTLTVDDIWARFYARMDEIYKDCDSDEE